MKKDRFIRVITSSILIGSIVLLAMLPSFAYSVDGVELVPVELTDEMIKAMFDSGDVTVFLDIWSSVSLDFNLYDMTGHTKQIISTPTSESSALRYILDHCDIYDYSGDTRLIFYTDLSFSQRSANGNMYVKTVVNLPFNYYLDNATFRYSTFYSGLSNDQNTQLGIGLINEDHLDSQSVYVTGSRSVVNWSSLAAIAHWYSHYNWVPEGYSFSSTDPIRTCYSGYTVTNISDTRKIEQLLFIHTVSTVRAQGSGTGYDYFFCAPMMIMMGFNNTVYVDPDIADTVEEYLDLIVNPSPADLQRIQDLKDEFEAQSDALHDAAEDIHKDMPTLPDVSGLPQEVTEGVEEATQYVITPLFGVGIVGTVVGTCLVFAVIKLLLYGSGPS